MADDAGINAVQLAARVTAAWLSNTNTRTSAADVPAFLTRIHETIASLSGGMSQAVAPAANPEHTPAVSVRKSLASREHILSMIDGKPYKTLRRHLSGQGLTPNEYRERYGLKPDYPMVAPAYSEARSAMAKTLGLGRKAVANVVEAAVEAATDVVAPKSKRAPKGVAAARAAAKKHLGG